MYKFKSAHIMSHSKGKQLPIKDGKKQYDGIEKSINDEKTNHVDTENDQPENVAMASHINASIIGNNAFYASPYGRRRIVYCDYIASGRSVDFIENFIR